MRMQLRLKIGVVLAAMTIAGCITIGPTKEERATLAVNSQQEM